MKILYYTFLALTLMSCKNYLFNKGLEYNGVYDDKVTIEKMADGDQTVVFIPMHHIGTSLFYEDVHRTIDSLKIKGYYFYTEGINTEEATDSMFRRFRRFLGAPVAKKGYKNIVDSVLTIEYNIKLKKELIDQPSNEGFGLEEKDSRKVDSSIDRLIALYEEKNGEIILEECDFETPVHKESTCKSEKIPNKIRDGIILESRNQIIVDALASDRERLKKIAIIYGKGHFPGVQKILLDKGYKFVRE